MQAVDYTPLPATGRGLRPGPGGRIGRRTTLTLRVMRAWFHFSRSVDSLILLGPGEGSLLALLGFSNLAFFLSWTMKAVIVPGSAGVGLISVEIGVLALVSVFGRTAAFYLASMVIAAVARLVGGSGTWRNTRVAIFWADFVTAPIGVAAALLSVAFNYLAVDFPIFGSPWIDMPPYWFGMLPLVWYVALGVARVHGFSRLSPVFMIMSLVSLAALVGGMYFHARGLI